MTEETPVLDQDEIEALLGQINTRSSTGARNYALLQLMVQTGIRLGEALQVKPSDIRREEWPSNGGVSRVWVVRLRRETTKGKQARQGIPLGRETRSAIQAWREKRSALGIRRGPLFCTISRGRRRAGFVQTNGQAELKAGKPLNGSYVRTLVKRLAEKAGIERRVHPHMLRHTALTALYDRTQDLRMVQDVAGHRTSRSTERYTHVHPLAVAEAMGAIEPDDEGGEQSTERRKT